MDARKERGRQLAHHGNIVQLTQGWRVPSSSGSGSYFVRLAKKPSCTCPDFEYWHLPCKHIYAVLRHEVARLIVWRVVGTRPVVPSTVSYEVRQQGNALSKALRQCTHSLWTGT